MTSTPGRADAGLAHLNELPLERKRALAKRPPGSRSRAIGDHQYVRTIDWSSATRCQLIATGAADNGSAHSAHILGCVEDTQAYLPTPVQWPLCWPKE